MAQENLPKTISNRRSFSGTVPVRSGRASFCLEVHHSWRLMRNTHCFLVIGWDYGPKSVIGKFTGQFPLENHHPKILRANQTEALSHIISGRQNFCENMHELRFSSIWKSPNLWPPDFCFVTEYLLFEWHGAKCPKLESSNSIWLIPTISSIFGERILYIYIYV